MEYRDKKKLIYSTITFYILIYYIFILFFKKESEYFKLIQVSIRIFPLIISLAVMIKLNLKDNEKSLLLKALCISVLFNFIGRCFEIYYKIILDVDINSFLVLDIASTISSTILFSAFIYKYYKRRDIGSTFILIIDVLVIICVKIAITWIYVILPQINSLSDFNLFKNILHLVYTSMHLGILITSIAFYKTIESHSQKRKSIFMIILAFLFMCIANEGYTYLLSKNSYSIGSMIEPLWTTYTFLLMLAAIEYSKSKDELDRKDILSGMDKNTKNIIPAFSSISLFFFITFTSSKIAWICFGISILLINIRQFIADIQKKSLILQLEEFNRRLEEKVEIRTKEIYEIASTDHLTGLINRRRFESLTKEMMEESKDNNSKISLLLIDLDRFKLINDNYGHSFGDLLIKEISKLLKNSTGSRGIVSRQGGDEFTIAIRSLKNENEAKELAEKVLKKLINPVYINGQKIYITCSIGISCYPTDGSKYEDLIRAADMAMYDSKDKGGNTYSFYEKDMGKVNSKRIFFERELRKAIEKNEFILHYQPQIDIVNKKVVGLEALIRWNNPTYGVIPPFQFIPIAEEIGLIGSIGEWVLETACNQTKKWHDKGFDKVKIGVNISSYQFQQDNFVDMVRGVLIKSKLNPEYLDLEITETIAMKNEIEVITKLKKLKKLGVQVSMDDFGTGYSSLSYLRRLPIDTLKIPREFIMEIKPYEDRKNIIEAIIAIAQKLDLSIIAEGVENKVQLNFLRAQGCKLIQGYLFSRPLEEDRVEELLKKELEF